MSEEGGASAQLNAVNNARVFLNEEFFSIQGEGLHTGIPMYFVRLQGCGVGCYFCDEKKTWPVSPMNRGLIDGDVLVTDVVKRAALSGATWMCITGGEPYEQPLETLVRGASWMNMKIHIETSGEPGTWQDLGKWLDWMTLSPKDLFGNFGGGRRQPDKHFIERANEIKCVVTKARDIDYYIKNYSPQITGKPLIFQPVDNNPEVTRVIASVMQEKAWSLENNIRLMLQQHKITGLR